MQTRKVQSSIKGKQRANPRLFLIVLALSAVQATQAVNTDKNYHAGLVAARNGQMSEAAEMFRASLAENTKSAKESRRIAQCLYQIGNTELVLGHTVAAADHLKSALAMQDKLLFPEHPDILRSLNALISLEGVPGTPVSANETDGWRQRKVKIEKAILGNTQDQSSTAQIWPGLDTLTQRPLKFSVQKTIPTPADPTEDRIEHERRLATTLADKHDVKGALKHYKQVLMLTDNPSQQKAHLDYLTDFVTMARTLDAPAAAEAELQKEAAESEKRPSEYGMATLERIATIYGERKLLKDQERVLLQLLALAKRSRADAVRIATFDWMIGHVILDQKRPNTDALPFFKESAELVKNNRLARHYGVEYGQICANSNQPAEAERVFRGILTKFESEMTTEEKRIILINLSQVCTLQKKTAEAAEFDARLQKMQ